MKKFFSLMIAAAFVFGTVGCEEKKASSPAKKEEGKKEEGKKEEGKKEEAKKDEKKS